MFFHRNSDKFLTALRTRSMQINEDRDWESFYQEDDLMWDHGEASPGLVDFLSTTEADIALAKRSSRAVVGVMMPVPCPRPVGASPAGHRAQFCAYGPGVGCY